MSDYMLFALPTYDGQLIGKYYDWKATQSFKSHMFVCWSMPNELKWKFSTFRHSATLKGICDMCLVLLSIELDADVNKRWFQILSFVSKRKRRDSVPLTKVLYQRHFKKAKWQQIATEMFDYTAIADRFRKVSWSSYIQWTCPNFPLPTTAWQSKGHTSHDMSEIQLSWVYWCFTSHATIFQSYMWQHRCAGGLKKKLYLRLGSQRHRHFTGFFNVPVLDRHGTTLFIRWNTVQSEVNPDPQYKPL